MASVKVFNDNIHPFESHFKGDPVKIKAKDYWRDETGEPKVMDLYEANDFRGDYHMIAKDGTDRQDPKTFKMIKLEPVQAASTSIESHVCQLCKHSSPSSHELDAHIKFTHDEAPRTELPEVDAKPKTKARA